MRRRKIQNKVAKKTYVKNVYCIRIYCIRIDYNVGHEVYGKSASFTHPMLVLKMLLLDCF
ncbi:hypothetical protein NHP190012_05440 [Helicobacter sp. NHP19-012]|uniref:Uncharacterized protein n=1 Tax=Helicobacter gastrofelis TaxID=2849642 RepID=A0ABM7SMX0_9HELI|nr:hypothetical protein NHP190012_05440 [Helicobacter sp. NHP19-012]